MIQSERNNEDFFHGIISQHSKIFINMFACKMQGPKDDNNVN